MQPSLQDFFNGSSPSFWNYIPSRSSMTHQHRLRLARGPYHVAVATVHHLNRAAQAKRRVLIVEDNLDSVHSMAVLVKMMGHECQFAINFASTGAVNSAP